MGATTCGRGSVALSRGTRPKPLPMTQHRGPLPEWPQQHQRGPSIEIRRPPFGKRNGVASRSFSLSPGRSETACYSGPSPWLRQRRYPPSENRQNQRPQTYKSRSGFYAGLLGHNLRWRTCNAESLLHLDLLQRSPLGEVSTVADSHQQESLRRGSHLRDECLRSTAHPSHTCREFLQQT